jgi:hypothetical protein
MNGKRKINIADIDEGQAKPGDVLEAGWDA